ncbi:MAG: hypothetical protein ACP5OP_09300, partial [Leptospirillia bacterium]
MFVIQLRRFGSIILLVALGACSSVPPASLSPEAHMTAFNNAVAEFSDKFAESKAISDFIRHFRDVKPTVEIARSRGLSTFEERLLNHRL